MPNATFQGSVMLAGWADSHNGGAKVAFWLEDPKDLDVFRGLTVAKGKTAGQRFAMVLVEIDDDEQPKQMEEKPEEPKGGALAKLAGQLCQNLAFRHWFWTKRWQTPKGHDIEVDGTMEAEETAEAIRQVCGVISRAELDHNDAAAEIFHEKIRKPWHAFSFTEEVRR
jgi:hypothetical protein